MRFRLTVTATREYEVDPKDYPDPDTMLETDRQIIADDPMILLDHYDTTWNVQVECLTKD